MGWTVAALMLLAPLVAMRFTDEVNWTLPDFVTFGTMLIVAGGAFELAVRRTADRAYRAAAGIAIATSFLLVWANGAVGILGSEDDPANMIFYPIPAVAIIGALVARLRPLGMARALVATAIVQALVGVIATIAGLGNALVATGLFVALWLASAWLFRRGAAGTGRLSLGCDTRGDSRA